MSDLWKIAAFIILPTCPTTMYGRSAWSDTDLWWGCAELIFAPEGVNSTCAGSPEAIDSTIALIKFDARFEGMSVKYSYADFNPFPKFKVKKKPEIVTFRQEGADPRELVGTYLEPGQWNDPSKHPEVITIDTRNYYEVDVGHFKKAINPKTDDFTAFAEFVDEHLASQKDKKIAMYCTGYPLRAFDRLFKEERL